MGNMNNMDINLILNYAYMVDHEKKDSVDTAYSIICDLVEKHDYNNAVTIFTMCLNKCLSDAMSRIDIEAEDFYDEVDNSINTIKEKFRIFIEKIKNDIDRSDDNETFIRYIDYIKEIILNGFDYHICKDKNLINSFDQLNRNEYIYDRMIQLTAEYNFGEYQFPELKKFTKDHKIIIPYWCAMVFDFVSIMRKIEYFYKTLDLENIREGFNGNYVHDLGKKQIIYARIFPEFMYNNVCSPIYKFNIDERCYDDTIRIGWDKGTEPTCIDIDLLSYLPFVQMDMLKNDGKLISYYDRKNDRVSKAWYRTVPMTPYFVSKNDYNMINEQKNNFITTTKRTINAYDEIEKKNIELAKTNEMLKKVSNQLKEANEKLDRANTNKRNLISKFNHDLKYKNFDLLNDSAKYFKGTPLGELEEENIHNNAENIQAGYEIGESLKAASRLLALQCSDDPQELIDKVRLSVSYKDNFNTVLEILRNSIRNMFIHLFYETSIDNVELVKKLMESKNNDRLKTDFEKNVLFNNGDPIEWLNNDIISVRDIPVSDTWRKLYFEPYNTADEILSEVLNNLVSNLYKYADLSKEVLIEFTEDEDFLMIKWKNHTKRAEIRRGRIGLQGQNTTINNLNSAVDVTLENSVDFISENNVFELETKISKLVFDTKRSGIDG